MELIEEAPLVGCNPDGKMISPGMTAPERNFLFIKEFKSLNAVATKSKQ